MLFALLLVLPCMALAGQIPDTGQTKCYDNDVEITMQDDSLAKTLKESDESLSALLTTYGITTEQLKEVDIRVKSRSGRSYFLGVILPSLLPLIILILIQKLTEKIISISY